MCSDDEYAIVSVGYQGRGINELVGLLRRHRVQTLVDVRLNAVSRKEGLSKSALAQRLRAAGIGYRHEPTLGNPKNNREAFRQGQREARQRYMRQLRNAGSSAYASILAQSRTVRIALLCYVQDHDECHRSCIVEQARTDDPNIRLVKL